MFLIRTLNISCHWLSFIFRFFALQSLLLLTYQGGVVLVSSGLNDISDDYYKNSPASGLCSNNSLSCSHQIGQNLSDDACQMIFRHKNSTVCESSSILKGSLDLTEEFGKMSLTTYRYHDRASFPCTALNVSFSDVKWTKIYMRFIQNQFKVPALCREFRIQPELAAFPVFFDCRWARYYNHSAIYHFDYQAYLPSGDVYVYKYIFFVPNNHNIAPEKANVKEWDIFMVVDMSGTPNRLVLRIQVPPKSLGITGFKVEVMRTLEQNTWVVQNGSLMPKGNETEIRYVFDTKLKFGKYKFHVTPIHANCTSKSRCKVSSTPEILIEMTEPKLLTGIVVTVILIPIFLMAYFIWKRQCDVKEPPSEPHPPKFLMLYKPVSVEHIKIMMELYKYFTKVCHVDAMLDQFGIPESESKDPTQWYSEAFNAADFVGIFASPETTPDKKEEVYRFNRYLNTEYIAQNQLSKVLCQPGARCKFFAILLPNSKWETLPPQAQALKRNMHKSWMNFRTALCSNLSCRDFFKRWINVPEEYDWYTLPRDLDPLLVLIGVTPQCDSGDGFLSAIAKATAPPSPNSCLNHPPPPPQPPPTTSEEIVPEEEHSLCCNTQSCSDLDLVSSRQYLSDMSTASSIDHLSLLGESN
ncbi:uncharacterized protein LOC106662284 isoform X2 [Cimex lectularius]|uniref:SEFIR domain-containing protein n=1 Tax=Cimex lectularius TaxID=79782 RepID=A0A8I6R9J3_CIMLE|nr:uncharacterized protein LOC106662284 isoform X2 [Cimex lectularius]